MQENPCVFFPRPTFPGRRKGKLFKWLTEEGTGLKQKQSSGISFHCTLVPTEFSFRQQRIGKAGPAVAITYLLHFQSNTRTSEREKPFFLLPGKQRENERSQRGEGQAGKSVARPKRKKGS